MAAGWRSRDSCIPTADDGSGLIAATRTEAKEMEGSSRTPRFDDLDPCWVGGDLLCFASTRFAQRAQYADLPVTNLYLVRAPEGPGARAPRPTKPAFPEAPSRITAERNGAEEPAYEHRSGRILFSRWWFNRITPSRLTPAGGAHHRPIGAGLDTANLWHCMEVLPDGSDERLACGDFSSRRATMAYQPAPLEDGTVAAVYAANLGLSPRGGFLGIQHFASGFGEARRLAGAIVADLGGDVYSGARGLAAPSACAPAALPDGRVVFSYAPGGRGDFAIYVMRPDGSGMREVIDLPGTLELDPCPIAGHKTGARHIVQPGAPLPRPFPGDRAPATVAELDSLPRFRYHSLNLFANGPLDVPIGRALAPRPDVFLRVFAALARSNQPGGDTAVLIRDVPIAADGSVDVGDLPAGVPLFEQLASAHGSVLASSDGLGHVAGLNAGYPGATSRCIGCHRGHSILLRDRLPADPAWFNAAPGAAVIATETAPGRSPYALVDRRLREGLPESGWRSGPGEEARVILRWPQALELKEVVLYGPQSPGAGPRNPVAVGSVRALRSGLEVYRAAWTGDVPARGRRVSLNGVADELILDLKGTGGGGSAGLEVAEVEILARLAR